MEEFEVEGENWGPLRAGLFGGTSDRFKRAFARFEEMLTRRSFF
jgi:hypothetical protein